MARFNYSPLRIGLTLTTALFFAACSSKSSINHTETNSAPQNLIDGFNLEGVVRSNQNELTVFSPQRRWYTRVRLEAGNISIDTADNADAYRQTPTDGKVDDCYVEIEGRRHNEFHVDSPGLYQFQPPSDSSIRKPCQDVFDYGSKRAGIKIEGK